MILCIILLTCITEYCCGEQFDNNCSHECPLLLWGRSRRAAPEYRWHASQEPGEFVVRVPDEEPPPQPARQVEPSVQPARQVEPLLKPRKVAVNRPAMGRAGEKLILGGAWSRLTSSTPAPVLHEYTRFVPPSTARDVGGGVVAPIQPPPPKHISPPSEHQTRNPRRDESPPSGPQFVPRAPAQYAPVAAVSFTRHGPPPRTPPPAEVKRQTLTRTTPLRDVALPTRTQSDLEEFDNLQAFFEDGDRHAPSVSDDVGFTEPTGTTTLTARRTALTGGGDIVTAKQRNYDYTEKKTDDKNNDADDIFFQYNEEEEEEEGLSFEQKLDSFNEHKSIATKLKHNTDVSGVVANNSNEVKNITSTIAKSFKFRRIETPGDDYEEMDEVAPAMDGEHLHEYTSSRPRFVDSVLKSKLKDMLRTRRVERCTMTRIRDLSFDSPRTLPEIESKLKQWAEQSPVAKWVDITDGNLTVMERPIYMMIVDDPSSGQLLAAKQTVLIVAGIEGREQHGVSAALFVLQRLVEHGAAHADLLAGFRFWVVPVLNPDGYDYAMTFPHRRQWSKNLRQSWDTCAGRESCATCAARGVRCAVRPCAGVNIDRNFEYQWIPAEERATGACGRLHGGARQLSEVESGALAAHLARQPHPPQLFLAFKEGDVLGVMYPYSHTRKKRDNDHVHRQAAERAAAAAGAVAGRPYVAGQTSEFLPLYAGGIEDWVYSHLGVDNCYTVMMFRHAHTDGAHTRTQQVVREAFAAVDTLALQRAAGPAPASAPRPLLRAHGAAPRSRAAPALAVCCLLCCTVPWA